MTLAVRLVADDPDLGPVRYCARCDEWWPQDAEFWVIQIRPAGMRNTSRGRAYRLLSDVTGYACRACRRERQAASARRRRARAGVPHVTIVLGPCRCHGCGALVVWTGRDWRTLPVYSRLPEAIASQPHRCHPRREEAVA